MWLMMDTKRLVSWVREFITLTTEPRILPQNVTEFCRNHRRTGQFFSRGAGLLSLPEKFFESAQKTAVLTSKITLPDSPHSVIISKNPGFRALYLARRNEFRFFSFNKYKNIFLFKFGCWLLPKKFSFCPKNSGFARSSYAYGRN